MATQPAFHPQWFDHNAALVAQIDWHDFKLCAVHHFPVGEGEAYRPITGAGFASEADLDDARRAYVDELAGFACDETTSADDMAAYLAIDATQVKLQDVIDEAVRASIHRDFGKASAAEVIARVWTGRAA